ncbi:MAG: hypothetical protein WKF76_07730 [Nocardioidaceae bacterium]
MNHPIKLTIAAVAALATSIAAAPPSEARDAWDTTRVHVTRHVSPVPKVVDLRVGEHPRFDRVVIDLRGKRTGYTVGYVRRLTYDGSGEQVPLRGRRFVSVRLTPTVAHNQSGASVYSGRGCASITCPPCAESPSPATSRATCRSGSRYASARTSASSCCANRTGS